MVTTIQINEKTLQLLKKLKEETDSSSYDEAIVKIFQREKKESLAGFLKEHYSKKSRKEILKDLRDRNDRY